MQASEGPAPPEGGCGPAPPKPGPETGAAPLVKAESFAGGEAKGGAACPLGSGAGKAPCAKATPAWRVTAAAVTAAKILGTMKRRIIKGVSPARSSGALRVEARPIAAFYDCWMPLTTRRIGQQRGVGPHRRRIFAPDSDHFG